MRQLITVLGTFVLILSASLAAYGGTTVFLNFADDVGAPGSGMTPGWSTNMGTLAGDAGVDVFSPAELALIEAGIKTELETIYSGFDITFVTTAPGMGGFDTIDFRQDWASSTIPLGASTPLGIAPFDWYNFFGHQTALVFPHSFDFIVDEYSASMDRPDQISQVIKALGGTAAHELGHSYGLRHLDAYADPIIGPTGMPSYAMTAGVQNMHVMATGDTGLGEAGREMTRSFTPYALAKLEITGSGPSPVSLTGSPITFTPEVGAPHTMTIDAQDLTPTFTPLALSGLKVTKVHGATVGVMKPTGTMKDMYSFTLDTDSILWAEVFSLKWYAPPETLELKLTLYDEMGDVVAGPIEFVHYSPGTIYDPLAGGVVLDSEDPALFNFPLSAGTYYLEVALDPTFELFTPPPAPFDGTYDLFVALKPVPEPGSGALAALSALFAVAMVRLRRRWGGRQ